MAEPNYRHILYTVEEGVAHVVLNRPERMNALGIGPGSNRDEIQQALAAADADDAVGSILLRANGKAFCAGGDLTGAAPTETPFDEFVFNRQIVDFYAAIRRVKKPVLAAVHGLCLGSAMGLIAQCDVVVAGDDARFGLIEGRLGHPGATEIVPLVGAAWAKFLILTGELIDAETAARIGLVLTVEPTADLAARATDLARRMASLPREGVILNKACIDAMSEAMGRAAGRTAGRAHDMVTKAMTKHATAPDGRRFEDILRDEGMEGLKRARDGQFTGGWLRRGKSGAGG
mgnify:CR=1 FL=1